MIPQTAAPPKPRKIHLSTALLLTIGLTDLVATLFWLNLGGHEGNPTFAMLWQIHPLAFITAKLLFLAGPITILEIARKYRPQSAEQGTWIAVIAYSALWLTQIFRLAAIL